ncbi:MAG: hypothetical protein ACLVEJ_03180 [Parabacteroides sp.]
MANYTETDEARLLADSGIIRNRLKVKSRHPQCTGHYGTEK